MSKKIFTAMLAIALYACGDGITHSRFCNLPARFTYTPVSSVHQLYAACSSPGEWCSITANATQFVFSNPQGNTPVSQTAVNNYNRPYMGLSGFLVGTPTLPEIGESTAVITCYDLACSNCYVEAGITRRMELHQGGESYCQRCHRTYDLNNQGIITDGDPGKTLYRYRVYYGNNTLTINN